MNKDPKTRIGVKNKDEIKNHEFFEDVDWKKLYKRTIPPPVDLIELKNEINDSVVVNLFFLNFRLIKVLNSMMLIMMIKILITIE